jgi:REP element-mobilizing transposase RayT
MHRVDPIAAVPFQGNATRLRDASRPTRDAGRPAATPPRPGSTQSHLCRFMPFQDTAVLRVDRIASVPFQVLRHRDAVIRATPIAAVSRRTGPHRIPIRVLTHRKKARSDVATNCDRCESRYVFRAMHETRGRGWGGRRVGAGRPRRSGKNFASHARRPAHRREHPVHVTLRVAEDAPSLRGSRLIRRLRAAFRLGRDRFGFRLAHYSVQGNHIHLIVEAHDKRALKRGLQGLAVRLARAVNRVHARRGRVFSRRYYAKPLLTPLQVRRALVYVLFNERRHLRQRRLSLPPWWLDSCSSAREFDGFAVHPELPPPQLIGNETTMPPSTELLRTRWRRLGLVRLEEEPGGAPN